MLHALHAARQAGVDQPNTPRLTTESVLRDLCDHYTNAPCFGELGCMLQHRWFGGVAYRAGRHEIWVATHIDTDEDDEPIAVGRGLTRKVPVLVDHVFSHVKGLLRTLKT
eukprot:6303066-Amphidinium_carterae.1